VDLLFPLGKLIQLIFDLKF
jgi:hypothetical protein